MNRGNLINRFEFHNYSIRNEEIDPITNINIYFFIADGKGELDFELPILVSSIHILNMLRRLIPTGLVRAHCERESPRQLSDQ